MPAHQRTGSRVHRTQPRSSALELRHSHHSSHQHPAHAHTRTHTHLLNQHSVLKNSSGFCTTSNSRGPAFFRPDHDDSHRGRMRDGMVHSLRGFRSRFQISFAIQNSNKFSEIQSFQCQILLLRRECVLAVAAAVEADCPTCPSV